MTATNTHSSNNTAEAQFLAPQTHQPAVKVEAMEPKASGFVFKAGGRDYDEGQIIAALRCAEEIFTAYARASESLGLGSRNVSWSDLDYAFDLSTEALSDEHRKIIDAECVAEYHGVEMTGRGIVVQTVDTDGEMEVMSASISEEHMELLLKSSRRLHVKNQDGVNLILYFDMDQETIVVEIDGGEGGAA
ncbi:ribosomal protein L18 [Variovorax boronicumulans]|uniref:Ribosomal protein L18 n=1 Tax=Variovorax boronicumulans TaxID=436515 RepID=A0AAW8DBA9_9BURK|nr:hypothetical protein [Variovorax boronicumulans]MDP9897393.1 ribosomal protein L18 [Variovorax boronicumulans]MDQ0057373.1 ribosomal protein L18 [Variovorax boronicumulans]